MPFPSDEIDPLADLRLSLNGDAGVAPTSPSTPEAAPPPSEAALKRGSGPPPLPPRRSPSSPSSSPGVAGPRVIEDPFAEPGEPRLPRGASPEEKLEYFRGVLRLKDETLARARSLYAEREAELNALRASAQAMEAQLLDAMAQAGRNREAADRLSVVSRAVETERMRADQLASRMADVTARLTEAQNDRKELSRALAEVEQQLSTSAEALASERASREEVATELAGAGDALELARLKVNELTQLRHDAEGNLKGLSERLQSEVAKSSQLKTENERLMARVDELVERLQSTAAERDSALAARAEAVEELREGNDRVRGLEAQLRQMDAQVQGLKVEQAALQASLEDAERKVAHTPEEMEAAVTAALEAQRQEWSIARGALESQLFELQADLERAQSEMEQQRTELEQQVQEVSGTADQRLAHLTGLLHAEEVRRQELEEKLFEAEHELAEGEGKAEALAEHLARLEQEIERERSESVSEQVRRLRDELVLANRKAMEAAGALQGERREKAEMKTRLDKSELQNNELKVRLAELAKSRSQPSGSMVAAQAELTAERDRLRQEVAHLKKKLMATENGLEAAAAWKAKAVRLEAQLKGKK